MNRLFVAYKPPGISSNSFLSGLKRKYGVKKAGFSGTLDPFAKGVLLIGFGAYTRLFRFLDKTPKLYRATLWLGALSASLDTENISDVKMVPPFKLQDVCNAVETLQGELRYTPPLFSAKRVNGTRAYELARKGQDANLKEITSTIYHIRMIHYMHPFVTFEAEVSEGTYIRSLGAMIAKKLGTNGSLSMLERKQEGRFVYENERPLDIIESLALKENVYLGDANDLQYGRKLALEKMKIQDEGTYYLRRADGIAVVTIQEGAVKYELGRVEC